MKNALIITTALSTLLLAPGCGNDSSGSGIVYKDADARVENAKGSVGVEGRETYWKCVGKLDAEARTLVASALQFDFEKGHMLEMNRLIYSDNGGVSNQGLIIQHVSSYVKDNRHVITVAAPQTNPNFPVDAKLLTYNDAEDSIEFHSDVTGEGITKIYCKDGKVEGARQ